MCKEQTNAHLMTVYYSLVFLIAATCFNANSSSPGSSCSVPAELHNSVHAVLVMLSPPRLHEHFYVT
jgi:hypothetical protein